MTFDGIDGIDDLPKKRTRQFRHSVQKKMENYGMTE
jgi:hypothetical protein